MESELGEQRFYQHNSVAVAVAGTSTGGSIARFKNISEHFLTTTIWRPEISREMDDSLKEIIKECENEQKPYFTEKNYHDIFDNVFKILGKLITPNDPPLTCLRPPLRMIFSLITKLGLDENFRNALRDDYPVLQILADVLSPSTSITDGLDIILICTELFTKDLIIAWKPPFLRKLVDTLFSFMQCKFEDQQISVLVLQILVNLCRKSVSCVLIAHENPKSKLVWQIIRGGFRRDVQEITRLEILTGHFLFLMTTTVPTADFRCGFDLVSLGMKSLVKNHEDPESLKLLESMSEMMFSLGEKIRPIYEKCESLLKTGGSYDDELIESVNGGKVAFLKLVGESLNLLESFILPLETLSEEFQRSTLKFMLSALPKFLPIRKLLGSYLAGVKVAEKLFIKVQRGVVYLMCTKFYLHVAEQLNADKIIDEQKESESMNYREIELHLQRALTHIEIDKTYICVDTTTTILQLLSTLSKRPGFADKVLKKMELETIKALIIHFATMKEHKDPLLWKYTLCVIEFLSLMAQFNREVAVFNLMLNLMSNNDISIHVAKCIHCGDERTVAKALRITGSIGFASNNLTSISKSIVGLRSNPSGLETCDSNIALSSCSGVKRVNDVLRSVNAFEAFETSIINKQDSVYLSNIITCYKMKQEMLEFENSKLNNEIGHVNKINQYLNSQLVKQSDVFTNVVLEQERSEMEVTTLQFKIHKMKKEADTVRSVLRAELDKVKEDMVKQSEAIAEFEESLKEKEQLCAKLESDFKAMKTAKNEASQAAKSYQKDKQTLTESLEKTKTTLDAANTKIASLQKEIAAKNEELSNSLLQLEQQKQLVNTIRGVLGHTPFGSHMAQNHS